MKRHINGELLNIDVLPELPDVIGWEKSTPKESQQTIRNMSSISQLKAGQTELREKLKQVCQILNSLRSSQWTTTKSQLHATHLSWQEIEDAIPFDFDEDLSLWERAQLATQPIGHAIEQISPPYEKYLSKIAKLFGEVEEDFDDIMLRITRCSVLEKELATFEDSLEDDEAECLCWCVSLIRDVLDYNCAEDLTQSHLKVINKGIGLMCEKSLGFSKADYQNLHREFLQSGLALLPTSRKAIDKYELTKANDGV